MHSEGARATIQNAFRLGTTLPVVIDKRHGRFWGRMGTWPAYAFQEQLDDLLFLVTKLPTREVHDITSYTEKQWDVMKIKTWGLILQMDSYI